MGAGYAGYAAAIPPAITAEACAACGGHDPVPHLRVAGELGDAGLIARGPAGG
jgi:hypothetical protein